jgi:type 1 fimbria pilin
MKKIFNYTASLIGMVSSGAIMLILLYVLFFSINESTGKSIAGSTMTFKGTITNVACSAGTNDIRFTIKGKGRNYYINRGLEKGLSCEALRKQLVNKEVEISHVAYFPGSTTGHINKLAYNGKVFYSELK